MSGLPLILADFLPSLAFGGNVSNHHSTISRSSYWCLLNTRDCVPSLIWLVMGSIMKAIQIWCNVRTKENYTCSSSVL